MVITKELNVNIDEFFDFLEKSVKFDIKNATEKDVLTIEQGYSYEKTLKNALNQKGKVITTIEKYKRNKCYQSKVTSNQGFNYITFDVDEIDNENIQVKYSEKFISDKKLNNMNYKIVIKMYEKRVLRRMNLIVENIEKSIKEMESELCQD